jgi:outer membrane beta-barrel protein
MKKTILLLMIGQAVLFAHAASAQGVSRVHEFFPFAGLYAADRFQNSFSAGFRYEFHFDDKLALGASVGFARASQDYYQKVLRVSPEQGSASVVFYNGRLTHAFPIGKVIPYAVFGMGVTKQHSESNFTFTLGLGTKFPIGKRTYIRYEINDHLFSSGQGITAWTNNNLEFALGLSFFLQ